MTSSRTQFCSLGVKWFPGRPKSFELNFTRYLKGRNSKTIWPCVRHHRTEKFINICTFCKMVTMQFEYHICISKLCIFLESVLHSYMRVILWSNILFLTLISSLTGLRVISSKIARDCRINCRNGIHTCWSIREQSTCVINRPEYVFILWNSEGDVNIIHYPDMKIPRNTGKSMMIQRRRICSRCFRRRQQLVSGFHHSGNACCPHFSPHQIPSSSNHDALRRMRPCEIMHFRNFLKKVCSKLSTSVPPPKKACLRPCRVSTGSINSIFQIYMGVTNCTDKGLIILVREFHGRQVILARQLDFQMLARLWAENFHE